MIQNSLGFGRTPPTNELYTYPVELIIPAGTSAASSALSHNGMFEVENLTAVLATGQGYTEGGSWGPWH